jgi:mRNA-degrading endonuclease toxin of MazEF toxin-antitoxin module
MATPSSTERAPAVGDVIEFSFLWRHEADRGLVEGVKDRRCVIVRILPGPRVVVVPITGTDPGHGDKIALNGGALGLVRPSWIVTSEINITDWPGHDLRRATHPNGAFWRYGRVSDGIRVRLADALEAHIHGASIRVTVRK